MVSASTHYSDTTRVCARIMGIVTMYQNDLLYSLALHQYDIHLAEYERGERAEPPEHPGPPPPPRLPASAENASVPKKKPRRKPPRVKVAQLTSEARERVAAHQRAKPKPPHVQPPEGARHCARHKPASRHWCRDPECRGAHCKKMKARGLWDDGSEMPKRLRPLCGATTRSGGTCKATVVPGRTRCRMHGGLAGRPKRSDHQEYHASDW